MDTDEHRFRSGMNFGPAHPAPWTVTLRAFNLKHASHDLISVHRCSSWFRLNRGGWAASMQSDRDRSPVALRLNCDGLGSEL